MQLSIASRSTKVALGLLALVGIGVGADVLVTSPQTSAAASHPRHFLGRPRARRGERARAAALAGRRTPALEGIGSRMRAQIATRTDEVVLVDGDGAHRSTSTVSLWSRGAHGWREVGAPVAARNGAAGWSTHRRVDDMTSPIGVFSLTAAGGVLENPGTRLPYEHDPAYFSRSRYLGNHPSSVFDYVVAIDFNREPYAPVSDSYEPDGTGEGGGIWLHVGDGRASAGCVTVARAEMVRILRWLRPGARPEIVMGDRAALAS